MSIGTLETEQDLSVFIRGQIDQLGLMQLKGQLTGKVDALEHAVAPATVAAALVPAAHRARVGKTGNQTVAHNTVTTLTWERAVFDTDGMHDNVTNNQRLTCVTPGCYLMTYSVAWEGMPDNTDIEVWAERYGSGGTLVETVAYSQVSVSGAGNSGSLPGSGPVAMVAGDYLLCKVYHYQGSGSASKVVSASGGTGDGTHFSATWFGP